MADSQLNNWKLNTRKFLVKAWGTLPLPGWLQSMILWLFLPKFLVGAVAVIFDSHRRVLLFHHTYRTDCPWGLSGGWLKKGEFTHEALEREVFEESGYRIRPLQPLVVGGEPQNQRLDMYYECEIMAGEFQPSVEVSDAVFFSLDELPECLEPFFCQVIALAASHFDERKKQDGKT